MRPHNDWRTIPLLLAILPVSTLADEHLSREMGQQRPLSTAPINQPQPLNPPQQQPSSRLLQAVEEIPDDIWNTIASPFDPIQTAPSYPTPPIEIIQPRPQPQPPVAAPMPMRPPRIMQEMTAAPPPQQQTIHYSVQSAPVPYELPPQEKVVAAYPEEYWNCLLNNLQGIGSDVAAKLITRACQKKHPKQ